MGTIYSWHPVNCYQLFEIFQYISTSEYIRMVKDSGTKAATPKKMIKPKVPVDHPKYIDMIVSAIETLKERTGSSRQAILKYICANYKVDPNKAVVHVRMALKRGVEVGTIKTAKESGKGAGSFKLGEKAVKPKKPVTKKLIDKKPTPKKAKKPSPKKASKKAPPKRPDSSKLSKKDVKKPSPKKSGKNAPAKKSVDDSKVSKKDGKVTKKAVKSDQRKPTVKKTTKDPKGAKNPLPRRPYSN